VSGTTGYDYATMTMPDRCRRAGRRTRWPPSTRRCKRGRLVASPDTVRVVYYVGDRAMTSNAVVAAVGPVFKDIRPAASMLIVQMIEAGMKIEIEVTARIGAAGS
jgi:hypothetical protein